MPLDPAEAAACAAGFPSGASRTPSCWPAGERAEPAAAQSSTHQEPRARLQVKFEADQGLITTLAVVQSDTSRTVVPPFPASELVQLKQLATPAAPLLKDSPPVRTHPGAPVPGPSPESGSVSPSVV